MNPMKTVFCKRLNQERPALTEAPFKGPIGELILNNVSAEAFNEWLEIQMKIINEERLDLSEERSQERLYQQLITFLNLADVVVDVSR